MKKLLISALALGTMSTSIYAGCNSNGCYDVTIDRLTITDAGKIVVGTSGNESALACTSPAGVYMTMDNSTVGKNAIFSLLLTARTTKSKISLRIINGSPSCNIAYAFVK